MPGDWLPIVGNDETLYDSYFARSSDGLAYENNWAFIVQETRFGGFRYHQHDLLLTAVSRHSTSPFLFIFPPLGELSVFSGEIERLAAILRRVTGRRIVLRKLLPDLTRSLVGGTTFIPLAASEFTHPRDIPEDVYPQVIISVDDTVALATSKFVKTRNQLKYFSDTWREIVTPPLASHYRVEVANLAELWNAAYRERLASENARADITKVDISAYTIFADVFGGRIDGMRYFGRLLFVGGNPVGFTFAGRVSEQAAALYCSLSLRKFRGAAEYLFVTLLKDLTAAGVRYLNLGGSETQGLFDFKRKFAVTELREACDLEYIC